MRVRTVILFLVAILLAGGTAMLVRSWLAQQRTVEAEAAPMPPPPVQKSVLVARDEIARGHILKPTDLVWQQWPDRGIHRGYIQEGTKPIETFDGWVARGTFGPGDPITEGKIVKPGRSGFLAAALQPGMRAVSVPVNRTSDVSGFILPGDEVDVLITHPLPLPTGGDGTALQHHAAETVLQNVRVLAVDQKLDDKGGEAILAQTATLELTPKQSEIIAVAIEMGKLSLSLRSLVPSSVSDTEADSSGVAHSGTFTLDSEVSRLLPKPFGRRKNRNAYEITVLRGNGKSETIKASEPAS
jgi:pilus assembly protein CpaB